MCPGFTQEPSYPNAIISFTEFHSNMYLVDHSHFHSTLRIEFVLFSFFRIEFVLFSHNGEIAEIQSFTNVFGPPHLCRFISPCRSLCESVRESCAPIMSCYGYPWPEILRCDQYPSDHLMCISSITNSTAQTGGHRGDKLTPEINVLT